MSSGDFNVTAAGGLVLGGIAALLLATGIALRGYGRPHGQAPTPSSSATAPGAFAAGGAQGEVEYLLDTSETPGTLERP